MMMMCKTDALPAISLLIAVYHTYKRISIHIATTIHIEVRIQIHVDDIDMHDHKHTPEACETDPPQATAPNLNLNLNPNRRTAGNSAQRTAGARDPRKMPLLEPPGSTSPQSSNLISSLEPHAQCRTRRTSLEPKA